MTKKENINFRCKICGSKMYKNGIRNNEYLGFRAWYLSNYSSKYIVSGGNRYGYN